MIRTRIDSAWRTDPNTADGFSGMPDCKAIPVTSQDVDDSTIMGPAGSVCSSVNELLIYYKTLMDSTKSTTDPASPSQSSNTSAIIPGADQIFASHAIIFSTPTEEATYGLGLLRSRLPGKLGIMSDNSDLVAMPVVGKGTPPQVIFNHAGTLSGFYSSVYLLPESETIVLVLVNSKPMCDSADWIGQVVLQGFLDGPEPVDFIELVKKSMASQALGYDKARSALDCDRKSGTEHKQLQNYYGRYTWAAPSYYLDIGPGDGPDGMQLQFMGRSDQIYSLQHYQDDTFTWLMTDEEEMKRGRFIQGIETYKLNFTSDDGEKIHGICWSDVGGMKAVFTKKI